MSYPQELAAFFRFTGTGEQSISPKAIVEGDIFRIQGRQGWLKATGDARLNEGGQWYVPSQPTEVLLG